MSSDHLFLTFGKETIFKWIRSLNIFRLCSMYPYPNDLKPERFLTTIHFDYDSDLNDILLKLDFKIDTTKPKESRFKELNENHSAGWIVIQNNFCYMEVNKILNRILLEVSGTEEDLFKMDELVFNRALKVEEFLEKLKLTFIEQPQDDKYCISPKYYPLLWD